MCVDGQALNLGYFPYKNSPDVILLNFVTRSTHGREHGRFKKAFESVLFLILTRYKEMH